jgi:hypothetical protein
MSASVSRAAVERSLMPSRLGSVEGGQAVRVGPVPGAGRCGSGPRRFAPLRVGAWTLIDGRLGLVMIWPSADSLFEPSQTSYLRRLDTQERSRDRTNW